MSVPLAARAQFVRALQAKKSVRARTQPRLDRGARARRALAQGQRRQRALVLAARHHISWRGRAREALQRQRKRVELGARLNRWRDAWDARLDVDAHATNTVSGLNGIIKVEKGARPGLTKLI